MIGIRLSGRSFHVVVGWCAWLAAFTASASSNASDKRGASSTATEPAEQNKGPAPERRRFVVLDDAEAEGTAGGAAPVGSLIAEALASNPAYAVAADPSIKQAIESLDGKRHGCRSDEKCLARFAKELHVDYLLHATATRSQRTYLLTLSLISSIGEKPRYSSSTTRSREGLPALVDLGLTLLLDPEAEKKTVESGGFTRKQIAPDQIREALFRRLTHDADYFDAILKIADEGRTSDRMTAAEFGKEAVRARRLRPNLRIFDAEREGYANGQPFSLPPADEAFRAYTNVLSMLNAVQAFTQDDFAAATGAGSKADARSVRDSLTIPRVNDPHDEDIAREFFYMMAVSCFRLGRYDQAASWLENVHTDAYVKQNAGRLWGRVHDASGKMERLEKLRVKPLTVLPFDTPGAAPSDAWMKSGLAEVLAGDLSNYTDLRLVERTQLEKVMSETKLAVSGLISDESIAEIGKLLQAGTLIVGSATIVPGAINLSIRLVDAETAEILGAASGSATQETLIASARDLTLQVLRRVDFVDEAAAVEARSSHAPTAATIQSLARARMLLANKGDTAEARRLYEAAMRDDPAYANLFADLKAQYSNISATVAVAPFVNVTGATTDAWMVLGAEEGLATDLGKLHFHVVERGQLQGILSRVQAGEVLSPEKARSVGEMLSANIVVLGAITHQSPQLRVDARFVEVKSGSVLLSTSVTDKHDDLVAALSALTAEVAKRFNEPMSNETALDLAAHRPTKEEFENHARNELAREALGRGVGTGPATPIPWLGIVTTAAGAALAGTAFAIAGARSRDASYYQALSDVSIAQSTRTTFSSDRTSQLNQALGWNIGGFIALAATAAGLGVITFDLVHARSPASSAENPEAAHGEPATKH